MMNLHSSGQKGKTTIVLALLLLIAVGQSTGGVTVTIISESAMHDTQGRPIRDCLQPKIYKWGDEWYAYGRDTKDRKPTCYSTKDFIRWTRRKGPTLRMNAIFYNKKNKEYVGISYKKYGTVTIAYTSPSPTGPFTAHNEMHDYRHHGFGDISTFQDTNGKVYLIYNKYKGPIQRRFAYIYQLDKNYYDVIKSSLCNTKQVMEGFWMFKRSNVYYLLGSGLVGYDVDDNFYLTAPSPLGPWTYRGLFAPAGSKTFKSQTFQGLQISGPKGTAYVFIGHRWNSLQPNLPNRGFSNARSIWLPLEFNADSSIREMKWYDSWGLDLDGEAPSSVEKQKEDRTKPSTPTK